MPDLITHATTPFSWSHQPGADCGVCHVRGIPGDLSLADKLNIQFSQDVGAAKLHGCDCACQPCWNLCTRQTFEGPCLFHVEPKPFKRGDRVTIEVEWILTDVFSEYARAVSPIAAEGVRVPIRAIRRIPGLIYD